MALSAAVHSFDKVAAGEKYNALRGQNTDRAGTRPRVLKGPAPQGAVTVGYVAAPAPSLSLLVLAERAGRGGGLFCSPVPHGRCPAAEGGGGAEEGGGEA